MQTILICTFYNKKQKQNPPHVTPKYLLLYILLDSEAAKRPDNARMKSSDLKKNNISYCATFHCGLKQSFVN